MIVVDTTTKTLLPSTSKVNSNNNTQQHPLRFRVSHATYSPLLRLLLVLQSLLLVCNTKPFCHALSIPVKTSTPIPPRQYFATCIPGLEQVLAQELIDLGGENVIPKRLGVEFTEPQQQEEVEEENRSMLVGLKSVLWLRTAHRVMELVSTSEYDICNKDDLHDFITYNTDIQQLLGDGMGGMLSLSVKVTANGNLPKELCHSHFTALTVKNALCDMCRDMRSDGGRPNVDIEDADVPLVLVLRGMNGSSATASLYRSLTGIQSMRKRYYRSNQSIHKAAMKESMASGLLLSAGYHQLIKDSKQSGKPAVLVDPMMGSGTFCIEAALIACDIAPGLLRQRALGQIMNNNYVPPAVRWKHEPDNARQLWKSLVKDATERERVGREWFSGSSSSTGDNIPNCSILGNEFNSGAMHLAKEYSQQARLDFGVDHNDSSAAIQFREGNCENWDVQSRLIPGRSIIVTNPPWGLRLSDDIEDSWSCLKQFLRKENCGGVEAWVLSGNKDLTRVLRMKKTRSVPLNTADESLRWIQYHIFEKY